MHILSNTDDLGMKLAQIGVLAAGAITAIMNFQFWHSRGDDAAAFLTVALECIAVGGLVAVIRNWRDKRLTAIGGLFVTFIAAGWGGFTMAEKLSGEAHGRAFADALQSPEYVQTARDLRVASELYEAALREKVPADLGPLNTEARSVDLERRRGALKTERDAALARQRELTPKPAIDALSVVRGFGTLLVILFGLPVFGFRHGRDDKPMVAANTNAPEIAAEEKPAAQLTASELGKLGAAAKRAKREAAEAARLAKNAYMREWRARQRAATTSKRGRKNTLWDPKWFGEQLPN